jgi:hypothetical protein
MVIKKNGKGKKIVEIPFIHVGGHMLKIWTNRLEHWTLADRSNEINSYF